ncbi:MAG: hypothetical protein AAGI91_15970, partial [Bacteroidota bacterium]
IKASAIEGLEVVHVSRIEEVVEHVLMPEPVADPAEAFALSERERQLAGGNGRPQPTAEGETVMN